MQDDPDGQVKQALVELVVSLELPPLPDAEEAAAASLIQSSVRGRASRQEYGRQRAATMRIQSARRGHTDRQSLRRQ
eukprot:COSAG05_NODE_14120_length_407_cov_0.996753_1_plen_76_part_01